MSSQIVRHARRRLTSSPFSLSLPSTSLRFPSSSRFPLSSSTALSFHSTTHPSSFLFSHLSSPFYTRRQYTNSTTSSSQATSIKDPSHPNLYYHPLPSPPSSSEGSNPVRPIPYMALSFLSHPPSKVDSPAVIGYLPAIEGAGINDFKENPSFRPTLHTAIRASLVASACPKLTFEASTRPIEGFMHITDTRNPPPHGRIGNPEDLIASVFVNKQGQIDVETYEALPSYRIVTTDGVVSLPDGMREFVERWMEKVDREAAVGKEV